MKHFSRARSRLASLPLAGRLVYSIFVGFTMLGLVFSAWLAEEMTGLDLAGLDAYYAGAQDAPGADSAPALDAGPAIELPPELSSPGAGEPMPLRKLLEVTHFHLFSMPIYLLVLSHLFMLSTYGPRTKAAWIGIATVSVAAHVAAPWIARTGAAAATLVYGTSGMALALSFAAMGLATLWEMWRPASA